MKPTLTLLLAALLLAPLAALHAAEQTNVIVYYVAANGADTNPGTIQQPFATLERARDTIRELKKRSGRFRNGRRT